MSAANRSALHERLALMVEHALPGTLVPIDSLRELLNAADASGSADQSESDPGLSLEEVARRCAALGSTAPVQTSAVRKWIRHGLAGVKLSAFAWGRSYRVREDALSAFLNAIQSAKPRTPAGRHVVPTRPIGHVDDPRGAATAALPAPIEVLPSSTQSSIQDDIAASRRRVARHSRRTADRRTAA